jgi:dTDP-4-amino-4,6-dideoxygalactose transaminase
MTVFSFGPIKTSTAFGGAVTLVRNPEVMSKMREINSSYPIQNRSVYAKKVLKYSIGMMLLDGK